LKSYTAPDEISQLRKEFEKIKTEKEDAIAQQDFEKAAGLRDREAEIEKQLSERKETWNKENQIRKMTVTKTEIAEIVSDWTGIPVVRLEETESQRLLKLEDELHLRVVGQNEAVTAVAKAVKRGRTGLKDPKRPIGSFVFLGPTGVGKTELCKALAETVFGDENALIRIDMSEYMEKFNVSRLVGSPPGYVGYDEGGQLSEQVRRKPYSVVLFDEIEKAHPDVFNLLLQILDDGILTDSQGRKIDFKNTIIIMTSNIGASLITTPSKNLGFSQNIDADSDYVDMKNKVIGELKRTFRPEFINRIDDIIVFNKLNKEEIKEIAKKLTAGLIKRLEDMEITTIIDDLALEELASKGFDPVYGARPLKRTIVSEIEDMIAEKMLDGTIKQGDSITVTFEEGKFCLK
ncbi:MAG: AAA family ATPase, partial [Clostridia bacterium]|nr:AAA family ATPase [Clostridia bacterium]